MTSSLETDQTDHAFSMMSWAWGGIICWNWKTSCMMAQSHH